MEYDFERYRGEGDGIKYGISMLFFPGAKDPFFCKLLRSVLIYKKQKKQK